MYVEEIYAKMFLKILNNYYISPGNKQLHNLLDRDLPRTIDSWGSSPAQSESLSVKYLAKSTCWKIELIH